MKKTNAQTSIDVICICPYCESPLEILSQVIDLFTDKLEVLNIDKEVECEVCEKIFIVENITF